MKKSISRIALIPTCLMLLMLSAACGIPTIQYLGPPDPREVEVLSFAPPRVVFTHNTADNDTGNFLGYEVYYKFYSYQADYDQGPFGTDYDFFDTTASGAGISTIENRGFYRVSSLGETPGTTSPPLIEIPPDQTDVEFQVTLEFPNANAASNPEPARLSLIDPDTPGTVTAFELIRDPDLFAGLIDINFAEDIGFESDDISTDPNDPDVPADIPETDLYLHMGLVLLAYGSDYDNPSGATFGPLYSDPLMLDIPLRIIID